ncbi:MAG: glycosyltransferase [wastewater metagenome]|nr:glycosyltransferase [Candidatus Loosdrechtia aerotolerans]
MEEAILLSGISIPITRSHPPVDKQSQVLPAVSIIIPVYNAEKNISALIGSLLDLEYPKELLRIVFVDNNSCDKTKEIIRQYPVTLLEENTIQSSYAARNRGIQNSKSEIIAFTDSDCIVTPHWIQEGVMALISESADLAGGKIEFIYSKHKTAAELYDSVTNLQTESSIKKMNAATTANLFVRSHVFEKVGLFPDSVKSGGDIQWTSRATEAGFILIHVPNAIIHHPARCLKELLKKDFRVGTGLLGVFITTKKTLPRIIYSIARLFLPRRLSYIRMLAHVRGVAEINEKIVRIWCISYLCNISRILGIMSSLIRLLTGRNRISSDVKILVNSTEQS